MFERIIIIEETDHNWGQSMKESAKGTRVTGPSE